MFKEDEIVRVLTGAIMEILPEDDVIRVPKDSVAGKPENERFCVQINARNDDYYAVRVVPLTAKQLRQFSGRTEEALRLRLDEGWKIKVWHLRCTEEGYIVSKFQAKQNGLTLKAKGGYTEVEIVSPDGNSRFCGLATCSPDDVYCRSEGRVVALDRAVALYEAAGFPIADGYPDGFGSAAGAQS